MPKVQSNGITLHYESFGEGEPLVLIMGIGGQMIQWDEDFCRALSTQGFRVIRFDNRDVGESEVLDRLGTPNFNLAIVRRVLRQRIDAPYTLDDMADDTVGLLDALGISSAHLVGMSLGGMIAQCVALRHPQRVRSLCSIMSAPGDFWAGLPLPKALSALTHRSEARGEQSAIDYQLNLFRVVSASPHRTPEARLRELAALHYQRGVHPRGFARQFTAILASKGRLRRLDRVRAPTLVIHGERDPLILHWAGRLVAARIPGARLEVIENMGHDLGPTLWPHVIDAITDNAQRKIPSNARAMGILRALRQRPIEVSVR
jgi:pimeloyl-ACP methyl ester carboxylesterase